MICNGALIIDTKGKIVAIGTNDEIQLQFAQASFDCDLDCTGKSVVPGLIDSHTHPVWTGDRCHEFGLKLAGATYMEIHQKGGGIGFTVHCLIRVVIFFVQVQHTRKASEEELKALLLKRLNTMLANGTVICECKSGIQ